MQIEVTAESVVASYSRYATRSSELHAELLRAVFTPVLMRIELFVAWPQAA